MDTKNENNLLHLDLNRDLLRMIILAMKVVPLTWIYRLKDQYSVDQRRLINLVHGLKKGKFLEIHADATGEKYVTLTKKGHTSANESGFVQYRYTHWRRIKTRIPSIHQEHHYLIFRFLLDYLNKTREIAQFSIDYDKSCKLRFEILGRSYYVRPDALIKPHGRTIIALEADTGEEEQQHLYEKLLKYILVAQHHHQLEGIDTVKIYFSFVTKDRAELTLSEKRGLLPNYFSDVNRFKKNKINERILISDVFKVLEEGIVEVYAGLYDNGADNYRKIDFLDLLRKRNKSWNKM